jgi:hypothetical protein
VVVGFADDGFDVRDYRPRAVTPADLGQALYVVSFGCDVEHLAPPSCRIERWDDVPLVSEDCAVAGDEIVARIGTPLVLVAEVPLPGPAKRFD